MGGACEGNLEKSYEDTATIFKSFSGLQDESTVRTKLLHMWTGVREYIVPECLESKAEHGERKLHVKNTWRIKNSVAKVVNICKAIVESRPGG